MSAPDTNISTQERRHRGALSGMALGVAFVAVLGLAFLTWVVANGGNPGGEAAAPVAITAQPAPVAPAAPSGGSAENSGAAISLE